jgi:adenylylsulfate kinase
MPGYIEIYLDVPLAELRRRDPKRIYERAGLGEITNVAGVDIEVDEPEAPNVHIKWRPGLTVETSLAQIVAIIGSEKFA